MERGGMRCGESREVLIKKRSSSGCLIVKKSDGVGKICAFSESRPKLESWMDRKRSRIIKSDSESSDNLMMPHVEQNMRHYSNVEQRDWVGGKENSLMGKSREWKESKKHRLDDDDEESEEELLAMRMKRSFDGSGVDISKKAYLGSGKAVIGAASSTKGKESATGDIAAGSYLHYQADIDVIGEIGVDAYRFSIAWSRIIPRGKAHRGVNEEGIGYYNNLINGLLSKGIKPFVTLFHWDLPQTLQDEYEGFLDHQIIEDFKNYAEICFQRFGDRVKNWITINQAYTIPTRGYATGTDAPGRCSPWLNLNCYDGDSAIEPYIVAHHVLLAHATVVDLYKHKYQRIQKGEIGITMITRWFLPYNNSDENLKATERAKEFFHGWFMDPLTKGHYPLIMKHILKERLPRFSEKEALLVKGSYDFIGVNYYMTQFARSVPPAQPNRLSVMTDSQVELSYFNDDGPISQNSFGDVYYRPRGILDVLEYFKTNYSNPKVYVTENGYRSHDGTRLADEIKNDHERIEFICSHLCFIQLALEKGCNVHGYFVWSLGDNYEFCDGYTVRFGLTYIDFANITYDRDLKSSGKWYQQFLKPNHNVIKQSCSVKTQ